MTSFEEVSAAFVAMMETPWPIKVEDRAQYLAAVGVEEQDPIIDLDGISYGIDTFKGDDTVQTIWRGWEERMEAVSIRFPYDSDARHRLIKFGTEKLGEPIREDDVRSWDVDGRTYIISGQRNGIFSVMTGSLEVINLDVIEQ